jgi:hypothetical protein
VARSVAQAVDLAAVAGDLGGLRVGCDGHIGQALELAHQHRIGRSSVAELDQRHVLDDAGQVNGRFYPRVAAADHRHPLALEQRAVAVRAVGHALVLVLGLAGHVEVAPARAGGQDHRPCLERGAAVQLHLHQPAGSPAGTRHLGALLFMMSTS